MTYLGMAQVPPGAPIIKNYNDNDYPGNSPQNWTLLQDQRGIMYFGNTEGVLEFDGSTWRLIPMPNNSVVRAMSISEKGRIFVGGEDEFGYLHSEKKGKLVYKSISDLLPEDTDYFGRVVDICVNNNAAYFISTLGFFQFKDNKVSKISNKYIPSKGFVVNNDIFVFVKKAGVFKLKNTTFEKLPGTEALISGYDEIAIMPISESSLFIISKEHGFLSYDLHQEKLTSLESQAEKYVANNFLLTGLKIAENKYAVGTLNGGIAVINSKGELLQVIDKNKGLGSNGVYKLYLDQNNVLWAGLVKGIAKIEINSPITYFNEQNNGIQGLVLSSVMFKGKLYLGTTNGIYYSPDKNDIEFGGKYKFQRIENAESYCWAFVVIEEELYAAGDVGLEKIENGKAISINEVGEIMSLSLHEDYPGILFMGLRKGMAYVQFAKSKGKIHFEEPVLIENFDYSIWALAADNKGNMWCSSRLNGIYKLFFDENKKHQIVKFGSSSGLPSDLNNFAHYIDDKILVGTVLGIYTLDEKNGNSFVPDTSLDSYFFENEVDVRFMQKDKAGRYWLQSEKDYIGFIYQNDEGKNNWINLPFRKVGYVFRFNVTDEGVVWLYSNHALFRYNTKEKINYAGDFNVLMRKVSVGADSVIFAGTYQKMLDDGSICEYSFAKEQCDSLIPLIDFKDNSISFEFSATSFENEHAISYSYYLSGFETGYGKWTHDNRKEYTNLKEGNYTFYIKAKNLYDKESNASVYRFEIKSPWYRTVWAYLSYILFTVSVIIIIVRLNAKRLIAANVKLENTVKERTVQVEQQKEELQAQADLLAKNNKELEKLSIVASETDNAVMIMDADGNLEWINQSLTRIYGYTIDEFRAKKNANLLKASTNPNIEEYFLECKKMKKSVVYESMITKSNGERLWAQTTLTPIVNSETGKIDKMVLIDTDISKLKEAQEEIKQQNEEIMAQRELLAKTNTELKRNNKFITDSIRYSKQIQEAILPSTNQINEGFPESFVFYKPRDIVSGDFYWYSKKGSKLFIAAVDCTGHGVPGALMSMIGNTILNEIVNEKGISTPANILDYLSRRVIAVLDKGGSIYDDYQTDGMDISLCTYDTERNELQVATANQIVYLFNEGELVERIVGDIYSVGDILAHKKNISFSNYKFKVEKGYTLYLSSDGYQDQFGGPDNKKFMITGFEKLLTDIQKYKVNEQHSVLSSSFERWKATNKQTDDVLVVGVRF